MIQKKRTFWIVVDSLIDLGCLTRRYHGKIERCSFKSFEQCIIYMDGKALGPCRVYGSTSIQG